MLDLDYNGDVFRLGSVTWGEDLVAEEIKRLKESKKAKGEKEAIVELKDCERLELRIAEEEFIGNQIMVILCDRYGNEKALLLQKEDFTTRPNKLTKGSSRGGGNVR
jgi:hypothetical protein